MSALRQPSEVSPEIRAYAAHLSGFGIEDIAVRIYGQATEETVASARALVEAGRRKSMEAH